MNVAFDLRHLRTLEAVVRLGSFAAAAGELGYTQSAISQQVIELERRVGAQVVIRRPLRVTEAGRVLLTAEAATRATIAVAAAELTALRRGDTGEIRVGAFISAAGSLIPDALRRLRAAHPGVRVILHELETADSHAALLRGELDLAVTFDYDHQPQPAPAGIARTQIRTDPVLLVLPAHHRLAGRETVDPADVPAEEWISTPVDVLAGVTDADRSRLDFHGDDFRTALALVAAGLGVTVLPALALTDAPAGVVGRRSTTAVPDRRIYTCRLDTAHVTAPVAAFQQLLRDSRPEKLLVTAVVEPPG
jgi:DNA-binding transcriptional LysR family regulator